VRHFDLDGIAQMDSMIEELVERLGPAVAEALGKTAPEPERADAPPMIRGKQTTRNLALAWTTKQDGTQLLVRVDVHRFIHPSTGAVNNTLELFVEPESAKAGAARMTLLLSSPVVGALVGLLGWRLLQWDTNMSLSPWVVFGGLFGAGLGAWAASLFTQRLGAILEGRGSLIRPANRRAAEEAAGRVIEACAERHREKTVALAGDADVGMAPGAEAEKLAAYAAEFVEDPDAAVLRYGLLDAGAREAVAQRFAAMEKDPTQYAAFLEARADRAATEA
jgi:hypothetical protein